MEEDRIDTQVDEDDEDLSEHLPILAEPPCLRDDVNCDVCPEYPCICVQAFKRCGLTTAQALEEQEQVVSEDRTKKFMDLPPCRRHYEHTMKLDGDLAKIEQRVAIIEVRVERLTKIESDVASISKSIIAMNNDMAASLHTFKEQQAMLHAQGATKEKVTWALLSAITVSLVFLVFKVIVSGIK